MATARHGWIRFGIIGLFLLAFCPWPTSRAWAQGTPDLAEVYAMVKSLQGRVANLEAENLKAKRDVASARAEAQELRTQLAARGGRGERGTTSAQRPSSDDISTRPAALAQGPNWGGLYAGIGFGLASPNASGAIATNQSRPPPATVPLTVDAFNTVASGRGIGAAAGFYLGYNVPIGSRGVIGGQVEGVLTNASAKVSGTTMIQSTQGSSTVLVAQPYADTASSQGMISLLARGGVLVDPVDLIYAIGGWTHGRFSFASEQFGLNGGTIGAGWERQIAPGWTIKGEGRYTRFQNKSITSNSVTLSGTPLVTALTGTTTHTLSADMWSAWVGVTHYFN